MDTMSRTKFNARYSKSVLIKTYKNGSEDFRVTDKCAKCNGTGRLTWTSVDKGICYMCEGTGLTSINIHVINDEDYAKKIAENTKKREKLFEERRKEHADYKPIDFKLAEWFYDNNVSMMKYYLIKHETEKAYLISFLAELEYSDYCIWIPKKAVIR